MGYRIALAGNPNSGKTTLFNALTGSNAHVGNWPGVTVERKEGKCRLSKEEVVIVDLPGIYSLSPYTQEEIIARDYLTNEKPDAIINIVDATNIERNLYLTTQLLELDIPVMIAFNMMDEVQEIGDKIDIANVEKKLGAPVIGITATKNIGIKELVARTEQLVKSREVKHRSAFEGTKLSDAVTSAVDLLKDVGRPHTVFYAVKLLEQDEKVKKELNLKSDMQAVIDQLIVSEEEKAQVDLETQIADLRYRFIGDITARYVKKGRAEGSLSLSDKIDKIVTNRMLGLPIFVLVMYIVFQIAVGSIGTMIADPFAEFVGETVPVYVETWLEAAGASDFVIGLLVGGIFAGIGSVLGFLPLIVLLFLCLSVLEDIGYMSRVAFVMDRIFRKFGLSGKAFVPLLMGYGCAVPAIMATRTLEDDRSRRLTVTLMPFMTCGARIPVYAVFAGAFFENNTASIVFSIYMLGILVAMLSSLILNKTVLKGEAAPFVMELPPYRMPTFIGIVRHTWEKSRGYVIKVGTILITMTVLIWLFQTYNFSFQVVEDSADSIFGVIGSFISPLFTYNGFGLIPGTGEVHWQVGAALLAGFIAKEVVISTLGILYINEETEELTSTLAAALAVHFTPLGAYSLMVFALLYAPCFAAIATAKKELNSWKWTLFTVAFQCGIAWVISMAVYQIGKILGIGIG